MAQGKRTCKNCKSTDMKYGSQCMTGGEQYYCDVTCKKCGKYWGKMWLDI